MRNITMNTDILIAVVVIVVILIIFNSGRKSSERLSSSWNRTNCSPFNGFEALQGEWKLVGSDKTYTFSSPVITLTEPAAEVVGMARATRAEALHRLLEYARQQGLYTPGSSFMRTNAKLRAIFGDYSSLRIRDLGAIAAPMTLTISGTKDVPYEYEICFVDAGPGACVQHDQNPGVYQKVIEDARVSVTKKSDGSSFSLRVLPNVRANDGSLRNELRLDVGDEKSYLIATQPARALKISSLECQYARVSDPNESSQEPDSQAIIE